MEEIKEKRKNKRRIIKLIGFIFILLALVVIIFSQSIYLYYCYLYKLNISKILLFMHDFIRLITLIYIYFRKDSLDYKLSYTLIILLFPICGLIFFYLFGNTTFSKERIKKLRRINEDTKDYLNTNFELIEKVKDDSISKNFNYMLNTFGYPLYKNEGVKYFETGEKFWLDAIEKIKSAKNYILIEFYMISEGDLLDKVLNLLFEKAKEKVEIKIILDYLGARKKIPKEFKEKLEKLGIEVLEFNKDILSISKFVSFRDHRKMLIIDGKYAYTGGINIADEYANKDEKYGYWKDGGMLVCGSIVTSYIVMFGKMYTYIKNEEFEYYRYIKQVEVEKEKQGYVMYIENMPENRKNPLENMFINLIYSAKRSIYIATPYLILSENFKQALINASNSGIDIKIVVPMIPDKLPIYKVTKSYYKELISSGIDIFEYSLGFIHSKLFLVDDILSSCGSINMDFRSFNLNYECTTITYNTLEEEKIKKDFNSIIKKSKKINLNEIKKQSILEKIIEVVLSIFKPLM